MSDFKETVLHAVKLKSDLTLRQLAVLIICNDAAEDIDRQTKALSQSLGISLPVVSRSSSKLELLGFVTRGKMAHDRRTCVMSITKKGRSTLAKMIDGPPPKKVSAKTAKAA